MFLYSEISHAAWKVLNKTGILQAPLEVTLAQEDPHFRRPYDWLVGHMVARGMTRPGPNVYPLWAWTTEQRLRECYAAYEDEPAKDPEGVLVEIEVPDDQVLLSDYMLWHCVLNGTNASDEDRALWPKLVFDLNWYDPYYHGDAAPDPQATFWTLHLHQVRRTIDIKERPHGSPDHQ